MHTGCAEEPGVDSWCFAEPGVPPVCLHTERPIAWEGLFEQAKSPEEFERKKSFTDTLPWEGAVAQVGEWWLGGSFFFWAAESWPWSAKRR